VEEVTKNYLKCVVVGEYVPTLLGKSWNFTLETEWKCRSLCNVSLLQPYEHPVRVNQIVRLVPEQAWYLNPFVS